MKLSLEMYIIIVSVIAFLGGIIGFLIKKRSHQRRIGSAEKVAQSIIEEAEKKAEILYKEALIQAKDTFFQDKAKFEKETIDKRQELQNIEKQIIEKESYLNNLNKKLTLAEKQNRDLIQSEKLPAQREKILEVQGFSDPLNSYSTIKSFNPGILVGGRYKVLFKLGKGGMGEVYCVKDRELNELRAIKVLPQQIAGDLGAINRLRVEAKIAMSIFHPNIVRLFNYERHEETHYLVMEYINGIDLHTYLAVKGPLEEKEVIRIGVEVANALESAHVNKVIHRDIKPSNIMLESKDLDIEDIKEKGVNLEENDIPDLSEAKVKLTDFGIAQQVRESMSRYSRGDTSGTIMYMSPEQIKGKGVDHRSDLYSLGVAMFELLKGEPPFKGEGVTYQILNEEPERIERASKHLNTIIMRLIAKDKDSRFQSARELMEELK